MLLPVVLIAIVVIPLLYVAFRTTQRSKAAGEHTAGETEQDRARNEDEFAAAEAYQEKWRDEEKKHQRDTIL